MKKFFIILFTLFLFSGNCFAGMPAFLPVVKSIQQITVNLSNSETSKESALTYNVNPDYTVCSFSAILNSGNWMDTCSSGYPATYDKTCSTAIRFTIKSDGTKLVTTRYCHNSEAVSDLTATVIEYYPYAVKQILKDQSVVAATTSTASISVSSAKRTNVFFSGTSIADNTSYIQGCYSTTPTVDYVALFYPKITWSASAITFKADFGSCYSTCPNWHYYMVELQPWVCP